MHPRRLFCRCFWEIREDAGRGFKKSSVCGEQGINTTMSRLVQQLLQTGKVSKLIVAPALVLLLAVLVGCGTSAGGQGAQSQAASTPTPSVSYQAQNCGKVETTLSGKPTDTSKAKLSENCFWMAFQRCQPATLNFVAHSLDTAADHTFTIKSSNGKCSISVTVKNYIVPNHLTATHTYTCGNLQMRADGLHFIACGSIGNILIPA